MLKRAARGFGLLAVSLAVIGLAGCGGGGGSSATTSSAPVIAVVPTVNGTKSGTALSVLIPQSTLLVSSRQTGGITLNATATSATASVGGLPALGTMQRDLSTLTSGVELYANSTSVLLVDRRAGIDRLTNASYGLVGYENATNAYLGFYHQGTFTPTAQIPNNVVANYSGQFGGSEQIAGIAAPEAITGRATVVANFAAGTMTGQISDIRVNGFTPVDYEIATTGVITGNTYSGTAKFNAVGAPGIAAGRVTSSAMNGGFYGANASETAGVVRLEGNAPRVGGGTSAGLVVMGAYGATRR